MNKKKTTTHIWNVMLWQHERMYGPKRTKTNTLTHTIIEILQRRTCRSDRRTHNHKLIAHSLMQTYMDTISHGTRMTATH